MGINFFFYRMFFLSFCSILWIYLVVCCILANTDQRSHGNKTLTPKSQFHAEVDGWLCDPCDQFRIIHSPECSVSYYNFPSIYRIEWQGWGRLGGGGKAWSLDSGTVTLEVLTWDVNGIHKSFKYSLFFPYL